MVPNSVSKISSMRSMCLFLPSHATMSAPMTARGYSAASGGPDAQEVLIATVNPPVRFGM